MPEKIYKYLPINEYTFTNLLNNQIWFSSPLDFNDPFDCKMFKLIKSREKKLVKFFKKKNYSDFYINNEVKEYRDNLNKYYQDADEKTKEIIAKDYPISCFSKTKENILMWSHYSNNHKGLCLTFSSFVLNNSFKYNNGKNKTLLSQLFNVKYKKKYAELDFFNNNKIRDCIKNMFKYKSTYWKYEEEVRIISDRYGAVEFKKEALTEIVFGCKSDKQVRKDIIKLIKKCNYPNVNFLLATKKENQFGLTFEEIKV